MGRDRLGDEEVCAALFEEHKNVVYKIAYLMLGNAEEAEDVLQQVFLSVHRSLSSFEPSRGTYRSWLRRMAVNQCLNRRRARRLFHLSLDEVSPATLTGPSSPEARLAEEEVVRQALNGLSEKLRAVVVLRYYSDLSYAEIATTLQIPVGTVKSRLDLALRTLRKELEAGREGRRCSDALPQSEAPK